MKTVYVTFRVSFDESKGNPINRIMSGTLGNKLNLGINNMELTSIN